MNQRVLVIDDSEDIHDLVRLGLMNEGLEVDCVLDGAMGIKSCRTQMPDLILLDIDMPKPDGFEVCRTFKSDQELSSIPIVFLTGVSSTAEKVKGLDLGAVDYVTKPFDSAELRARVSAALRTKYLMDLLAKRAMIDGLTGLFNRAHFEQRLSAETSLAGRNGQQLSCLMIDVDHFKSVNDKHGHAGGDVVLQKAAKTIMATCRLEDVVCRYGGEEFVVLAPNTAIGAAMELAARLVAAIAGMQAMFRTTMIPITCSIGVADLAHHEKLGIVQAADKALYRAKGSGRNRVECATAATVAA